ncbi:MAG: PAS domain-containing protein [Elusimicrobia bacterium]|nr:PAS domain-containing protein [Elusimicrobiota bacterium]
MSFQHAGCSWYDDEIRCVFEAMPDKVFVVSEDGTFIKFHTNKPEHLAAKPEDLLGKKIADILPHGVAHRLMKLVAAALVSEKQQCMIFKAPTLSKEVRDWEARIIACDPEKVLILVRDMTDLMEAERGRLSAERAIEDLRTKGTGPRDD